MKTAIDTNVLSAVISGERGAHSLADELFRLIATDHLIICAPVYSELLAHPITSISEIDLFLTESGISIDYKLDPNIWLVAGTAFRHYAQRRRKSKGGEPKRLLIDFVVGAHASLHADRLFTLDRNRYTRDFPKLRLN